MKKMMLIDGSSLLFRSFYALMPRSSQYGQVDYSLPIEGLMRSKDGTPTNAIFGLSSIIFKLMSDYKVDYALAAFDTSMPTKRHEVFEEYKGTRKKPPIDLIPQFALSRELFSDFGITVYEEAGVEADDIIGTLAKEGSKLGLEVIIISGDKDLLQLVDDNITVYLTRKGVSDLEKMDEKAIFEKYELSPTQIPDLKGLMGDPSDNIPGVRGVGEKTAIKLLKEFNNVETIVKSEIKGKIGEKIKEEADNVILYKKLATIICDLPLPFGVENICYNGINYNNLARFFRKYDLNMHLRRLNQLETLISDENNHVVDPDSLNWEVIDSIENKLKNEPFSIVVEQLGKNYFTSKIKAIGIYQNNKGYLMSIDDVINDKKLIKILEDEKIEKYALDVKQTINALNKFNIKIKGLTFDLYLATYLLEPSLDESERSVFNYHSIDLPFKEVALKNFDDNQINEYVISKAKYIYKLKDQVINSLKERDQLKLYCDLELPLASILAKMEQNGIRLDISTIRKMEEEVQEKLDDLTLRIYKLANKEFNINSYAQVAEVLYDDLNLPAHKKRSTAADYLEEIASFHPIVNLILDYRKYAKLQGTYIKGLQNFVHGDGKIHTIYNQFLTQTGRLSSKEPNLQNITIRDDEQRMVRKAFLPSNENSYLLSIDYSQIELRVLAHMADATSLINAFNNDEDIHLQTAMKIFDIENKDDVTSLQRRQAKAVNFGIIYGISDWGLAEQLGVSVSKAKDFINKYFATFPEIKTYLDKAVSDCEKNGYVKTLFNRIRYVKEINDPNYTVREFGKRVAMNAPIQGTAADIIKKAMLDIDKLLNDKNYQTKMLLQIHDELVFEVPENELMEVIPLICETMENAASLKVRLKVDYGYGKNWYDAK